MCRTDRRRHGSLLHITGVRQCRLGGLTHEATRLRRCGRHGAHVRGARLGAGSKPARAGTDRYGPGGAACCRRGAGRRGSGSGDADSVEGAEKTRTPGAWIASARKRPGRQSAQCAGTRRHVGRAVGGGASDDSIRPEIDAGLSGTSIRPGIDAGLSGTDVLPATAAGLVSAAASVVVPAAALASVVVVLSRVPSGIRLARPRLGPA